MNWQKILESPFREEIVDMSWPEYLMFPAMNNSTIVNNSDSPKHVKYNAENRSPPTAGQLKGIATHAYILDDDTSRLAVYDGRRDPRAAAYKAFLAEHQGKDILNEKEYSESRGAADAVLADPDARAELDATDHEVTLLCEDEGMQIKARLDCLGAGKLIDVKGTANIHEHKCGKVFADLNYGVKLGMYRRWARKLGCDIDEVVVIWHEQKPPYDVAVDDVPEADLELGEATGLKWLREIRECIESDHWPGIARGKRRIVQQPNWALPDEAVLDWSTP